MFHFQATEIYFYWNHLKCLSEIYYFEKTDVFKETDILAMNLAKGGTLTWKKQETLVNQTQKNTDWITKAIILLIVEFTQKQI